MNTDLITQNTSLISTNESNTNIEITKISESIKEDFEQSRTNIKTLIETGMDSLDSLSRLAQEAEHPRVYEALSNMINTLASNHKMLLDISIQYKKHLIESLPKQETHSINNIEKAVFIGSTADLMRNLDKERSNV